MQVAIRTTRTIRAVCQDLRTITQLGKSSSKRQVFKAVCFAVFIAHIAIDLTAQPNYDPYHQFYDPTTGQYIMPANVYDPRAHQEAAYAGGAAPLGMVGPADGVYQGDPYQSHDVQHISATSRSSRRISTEYHTMYDPRTGQAGTPVGTSPPPNIARMGTPGIPNYPPKRPSHQGKA